MLCYASIQVPSKKRGTMVHWLMKNATNWCRCERRAAGCWSMPRPTLPRNVVFLMASPLYLKPPGWGTGRSCCCWSRHDVSVRWKNSLWCEWSDVYLGVGRKLSWPVSEGGTLVREWWFRISDFLNIKLKWSIWVWLRGSPPKMDSLTHLRIKKKNMFLTILLVSWCPKSEPVISVSPALLSVSNRLYLTLG